MLTFDEQHLPPDSQEPSGSIERAIGELVATAVGVLNQGLVDWVEHGGMRQQTRVRGGDVIAQLYDLRLFAAGSLDFEATAKEYGRRAVREFLAGHPDAPVVSDAQIDAWVAMPLDILAKVMRARIN
jgi:hypothetical protein